MDLDEAKDAVISALNQVYCSWRERFLSSEATKERRVILNDMDETHAMVIGYIDMLIGNELPSREIH